MFRNNLYLKVPIHYQLVRGGQVVKADAFIRPKKKKNSSSRAKNSTEM